MGSPQSSFSSCCLPLPSLACPLQLNLLCNTFNLVSGILYTISGSVATLQATLGIPLAEFTLITGPELLLLSGYAFDQVSDSWTPVAIIQIYPMPKPQNSTANDVASLPFSPVRCCTVT